MFSLGQGATTVRMQPFSAQENEQMAQLSAVGSNQGIVRLVEISNGTIYRELHIHTCPIK